VIALVGVALALVLPASAGAVPTPGSGDPDTAPLLPFAGALTSYEASNVGVVPASPLPVTPIFYNLAWYRVQPGAAGSFSLRAMSLTTGFDPTIEVYDSTFAPVASNDDTPGGGDDAQVWVHPATGNESYYVALGTAFDSALSDGDALLGFIPSFFPPGTPTDVVATPGNGSSAVSWTPVTTGGPLTEFAVLHRTPGNPWEPALSVPGTQTTATLTGLTNGTTYEVAVAARTTAGWGGTSDVVTVTPTDLLTQTVTIDALPATVTYGAAPVPVAATATSGLAATLEATGPCEITAGELAFTGVGTCLVTATQAGDATYAPATASATVEVLAVVSTVTIDALTPIAPGYFVLGVTVTAGGATVTSGTVHISALPHFALDLPVNPSGITSLPVYGLNFVQTFVVEYPGTATVAPSSASATFDFRSEQTIGLDAALPAAGHVGDSIPLPVLTSAGFPVTYLTTTAACTVSGATLTLLTVGTCSVEASNAGSTYYLAVLEGVSLPVELVAQTITLPAPVTTMHYGEPDVPFTATASSGLPVAVAASGACTFDGSAVHLSGVGECSVTATQAGDATYAPASGTWTTTVLPRMQTVTITGVPATRTGAGTLPVTAASSLGLPVTITATGPCTWAAGVLSVVGTGECTVTAASAGDPLTAPATATARMAVSAPGAALALRLDAAVGDRADGASVLASGSGLKPGATLTITVYSAPVVVGATSAGADGVAQATGVLPALAAGTHRAVLTATGLDGSAVSIEQSFGVGADGRITWIGQAPPGRGLAWTGLDVGAGAGLALIAVLVGLGLLLIRRRSMVTDEYDQGLL
jgi:hypothetical protein